MKEADLDKRLMARLKRPPVLSIKMTMFNYYGGGGWPDRLGIGRCVGNQPGPRFWFVELKSESGRLTPRQKMRIDQLESLGCEVWVLKGRDAVDGWCDLIEYEYTYR